MTPTDLFIHKARIKHGGRYDYSKAVYVKSNTKLTIICKIHGEYEITPNNHLCGQNCVKCSKNKRSMKIECFIEKANSTHNNKYDYSRSIYVNNTTKITIICKTHGSFEQRPLSHLQGKGCPKCYRDGKCFSKETFINKSISKFGKYFFYDKVNYTTADTPVIITCPIHGDFKQTSNCHLSSEKGCPHCSTNLHSLLSFVREANIIHGIKYDYSKVVYVSKYKDIEIICPEHGLFLQRPATHLNGAGCPLCDKGSESYFYRFIKSIYSGAVVKHDRSILKPNELDFYLPDKKLGFEFNGIYWHSNKFKNLFYHQIKQVFCFSKDISLIEIQEDMWLFKNKIIKKYVTCFMNRDQPIHINSIEIKPITLSDTLEFVNKYSYEYSFKINRFVGVYLDNVLWSILFYEMVSNTSTYIQHYCTRGNPYCTTTIQATIEAFMDYLSMKTMVIGFRKSLGYSSLVKKFYGSSIKLLGSISCVKNVCYKKRLIRQDSFHEKLDTQNLKPNSLFYDSGDILLYCGNYPAHSMIDNLNIKFKGPHSLYIYNQ